MLQVIPFEINGDELYVFRNGCFAFPEELNFPALGGWYIQLKDPGTPQKSLKSYRTGIRITSCNVCYTKLLRIPERENSDAIFLSFFNHFSEWAVLS